MMYRNDWDAVYLNQQKILEVLSDIDGIFLAGGTAVQCYILPRRYRESEDLDFFTDHAMSPGESAKISRLMTDNIRRTEGMEVFNIERTEQGTHRLSCGVDGNDEVIKVELLDFTAARYGDKSFIVHPDYPRIENDYNLLLYKLKALCDRIDTIKDLFDIYFLFKTLKPIDLKEMLMDLRLKFEETTGYIYSEKELLKALDVSNRNWDIVPTEVTKEYWEPIKEAVDAFRLGMIEILLDPQVDVLDFTYETYLEKMAAENGCTKEEFLDFFESNAFIEHECRVGLSLA